MLTSESEAALATLGTIRNPENSEIRPDEIPDLLHGATACLTGWGTPHLDDEVLIGCPELKLVAHTAGSIRRLISQTSLERGTRVTHAAHVIAQPVAEMVVSQALLCIRRLDKVDQAMKSGSAWLDIRSTYGGARLLRDRVIGVVGAGMVGSAVIRLFTAFGAKVVVYDPLLTAARATDLGVASVSLHELFGQADIVSIHVPVLPETTGMIDETCLSLLRDGSVFINTARAAVIDYRALYAHLHARRIIGALDVFPDEPLPLDDAIRNLPDVLLSPHMGGMTVDSHQEQGEAMVGELSDFFAGKPLRHEIMPEAYPTIA